MASRSRSASGRDWTLRRQLRVLCLAAKIIAWPIVRAVIRFLFFWVLVLVWFGSIGIAIGIFSQLVNSDSPPALRGAGQLAALVVFVVGGIGLYKYFRRYVF
jgi:hypothetical protein